MGSRIPEIAPRPQEMPEPERSRFQFTGAPALLAALLDAEEAEPLQKPIRVGNAGGYWGDDPEALKQQIEGGHLDYVTMDFLAELTMSILRGQQIAADEQRKLNPDTPEAGYAKDFPKMLIEVLEKCLQNGTKIIANAGGINPEACARMILKLAEAAGIKSKPRIAIVQGDNIRGRIPELQEKGCLLKNMDTGENFESIADRVVAANVYHGASAVVEALKDAPDIIITGRVTDTGITLATWMHEFRWNSEDWDKLAAGIVAGHIIECGCQATGGNFTDCHKVPSWENMGYPIVEMQPDGSFIVTKHPNTGGIVTVDTVKEQLVYEMGNPEAYISPDVVADFTSIRLQQVGENRVRVSGIKGYPPTERYKVSVAYKDGWKCEGKVFISGPNARKKAELFAKSFWKRFPEGFFEETLTEFFGDDACHRGLGGKNPAKEIELRLCARSSDKRKLERFSSLILLILNSAPGIAAPKDGRPKVTEVISYWPALLPKGIAEPQVAVLKDDGTLVNERQAPGSPTGNFQPEDPQNIQVSRPGEIASAELPEHSRLRERVSQWFSQLTRRSEFVTLEEICLARSGDKGDTANIGVLARGPKCFAFLQQYLTAQRVRSLFQELCHGSVTRYELENLLGFNFLLEESLGGGGSRSLRVDPQGKTFAQALLRQKVRVPREVLAEGRAHRQYSLMN